MSQLRIRELSDAPFGADIEGLDPGTELGADDKALLQRAFDERVCCDSATSTSTRTTSSTSRPW